MQVTAQEMMAVFVSRQVQNGDYISVGTNLPVPTAGVLLAHLIHAPDAKLSILSYFTNLTDIDQFEDLTQIANPKVAKWAEAVMSMEAMVNAIPRMDICFAGGIQIDRYGNTNLIGIGTDPHDLKFRGPGSVGTSTVMALVKKYFIFTNDHSRRTLVEKCDFRSSVGWDRGGADARAKLGLPGGGPQYVITPKAILDFDETSKALRLKYVLPPATIEEIVANTGFELIIPDNIAELEAPTTEEITVLRNRVDPKGFLRRS